MRCQVTHLLYYLKILARKHHDSVRIGGYVQVIPKEALDKCRLLSLFERTTICLPIRIGPKRVLWCWRSEELEFDRGILRVRERNRYFFNVILNVREVNKQRQIVKRFQPRERVGSQAKMQRMTKFNQN